MTSGTRDQRAGVAKAMPPRRMTFRDVLRYRGGMNMYAWVLHRLTGLGVLLFLMVHIVETFFLVLGPEAYNSAIAVYKTPVFKVAELGLTFAVLYHAVNGVRVTVQDFWPALWRYERAFIWISAAIVVAAFVPLVILSVLPLFQGEY